MQNSRVYLFALCPIYITKVKPFFKPRSNETSKYVQKSFDSHARLNECCVFLYDIQYIIEAHFIVTSYWSYFRAEIVKFKYAKCVIIHFYSKNITCIKTVSVRCKSIRKYRKYTFGETRSTLEDFYLPDVVRLSVVNIGLKYGIRAVHKLR